MHEDVGSVVVQYLRDVNRIVHNISRVLPVDTARLCDIFKHRVAVDTAGRPYFANDGTYALDTLRQTVTEHNLRYSVWCLEGYARWLRRWCRLHDGLDDADRRCILRKVASTSDAHDTHGRPLYVGDVIDSSVLFGPLGMHQFSHSSIYIGGGFVAHIVLDRSSVRWGMRNPVHQALALSLPTFMCSLFTVARKCDMNIHGFVYSRTGTAQHSGVCRRGARLDIGMDCVPESYTERWTRVGCAVACTGIYGYNLPNANCQHFINSLCGGRFFSQTTHHVTFFFACMCAAVVLILFIAVAVYTYMMRRKRRSLDIRPCPRA